MIAVLEQRTDYCDHPNVMQLTELIRRPDDVSWGEHHKAIDQAVHALNRQHLVSCRYEVIGDRPSRRFYLPLHPTEL